MKEQRSSLYRNAIFSGIMLTLGAAAASGQISNQIIDIIPDTTAQGTMNLLVTFTLDSDVPPPPPAGVMPDSVSIAGITGTSVTHDSQYIITAVFDIPGSEAPGTKDATISFTTPNGSLMFSMAGGFTVTAGADMPPTIAQHPQSRTAPPESAVTFTVEAWGSDPLTYQWQKDETDISDATGASYTINPVEYADAGFYRCIVTNNFGTETSNDAELTVSALTSGAYPIVDTAQEICFNETSSITDPSAGDAFYGQDAQFTGNAPSYAISGDGLTVYDNVTGLTWTRDADIDNDGDIDVDDKLTYAEAPAYADTLNAQNFGGYSDWRVPSIKEQYSLMDFRGTDPMVEGDNPTGLTPFIDLDFFEFAYGDTNAGERIIDSQWVTTTLSLDPVMTGQTAMFGVNFADGRIKGYPATSKTFYVRLCRGNTDYGINNFTDNGDGTITDLATGLMWSQDDSGDGINTGPRSGLNWEDALAWVQQKNTESYLGYNDWRLPNAKEMQSIVDYERAPGATSSAAIDPIFNITQITNESGEIDYPWFWTGTTHQRFDGSGSSGVYICFGRGMGYMNSSWLDVHGAGCQRSDDKSGDFEGMTYLTDGYYFGDAPQGDATRSFNYVRLVRDADLSEPDEPYEGYNLFSPLGSTTTYLMDNEGNTVHSWESAYPPGNSVYLLDDGNLLRTGNIGNTDFSGGGGGGIVEKYNWCGDLIWQYTCSSSDILQHHDVEMLPNGNILMIAWEKHTLAEALAAGRDSSKVGTSGLYTDMILEVKPTGTNTGEIVWQWHIWDHLVQDVDASKNNYGVVADHPELINLNFSTGVNPDWNHTNSIDYNAELDQIVLSVRNFSEIWIIDHSTTTAEAAGHTGGSSGKGGDLLYRWGNPQAYDAGSSADQMLFVQHDAEWIADDLPGAGNILIFNNGQGRSDGDYSSIEEISTPVNPDGSYTLAPESAWGPVESEWSYVAETPTVFYASHISGSQRLPNGNTLICNGPAGRFFEVTTSGSTVWEYTYSGGGAGPDSQVFRVERYGLDYTGISNPADLNGDGVVDDDDLVYFMDCVSGPNEPLPSAECEVADFDNDNDVDLKDFRDMQVYYATTQWSCD